MIDYIPHTARQRMPRARNRTCRIRCNTLSGIEKTVRHDPNSRIAGNPSNALSYRLRHSTAFGLEVGSSACMSAYRRMKSSESCARSLLVRVSAAASQPSTHCSSNPKSVTKDIDVSLEWVDHGRAIGNLCWSDVRNLRETLLSTTISYERRRLWYTSRIKLPQCRQPKVDKMDADVG